MYRPTVRYDDVFKEYINNLFHSTHLDRNQLIRAALFAAAHSREFRTLLQHHLKRDVPLPSPLWKLEQDHFWMEQCPGVKGGGGDVNAHNERKREANEDPRATEGRGNSPQEQRRIGPVPSERIAIREQGGITFTLN